MHDQSDDDPIALLADADPAGRGQPPDARARVWTQISDRTAGPGGASPSRVTARRAAIPVALALMLMAGGLALSNRGGGAAPATPTSAAVAQMSEAPKGGTATQGATPAAVATAAPGGLTSCVRVYDLGQLALRSWAFDGTLVGMADGLARFRVNEWFRGSRQAEVTLKVVPGGGSDVDAEAGPRLVEGGRYLVSGEEAYLWGCGFTRPYDPDTASRWRVALAG